MTQSTPTDAWLKEVQEAATKSIGRDGSCSSVAWATDSDMHNEFICGAQWQRERKAPDEQEWEKAVEDLSRELMEVLSRRDELKAEAASLRAENERLKNFGAWQGFVPQYQEQIDTLRNQLAEATEALEAAKLLLQHSTTYEGAYKVCCNALAKLQLSELKAGREEG